jgi:exodeoxyribonuclease V gamma subunit
MLHVHRSDRTDALVSMLAELVADPLEDPMTPEVVSVPTQGIERWLTQRLSGHLGVTPGGHDGVCANIAFPFPGALVSAALARATGNDPKADPWLPERAVWPLMEVVEEHFDEPWLAPLAQHIRKSGVLKDRSAAGTPKRFSIVRHMADLFDRYGVHRPDMLQRWAAGLPQLDEAPWQFELWRLLRERIDRPSPAEHLQDACLELRRTYDLLELPDRLSLFGLTRLPASYLDVLDAVAHQRDVHLFLLHPSPELWRRLEGKVGPTTRHLPRREDPTASVPANPLLASWGRDAREMQLVLGGARTHGDEVAADQRESEPTLLQQVQDDVRADRVPAGVGRGPDDERRPVLRAADDSIRVHSCHGRGRQVEVLRDAILHLLADDPELEPRDIIVMCPDIEHFAPLIQATFGAHDQEAAERDDGTRQLKIRLADRSLRQTNPVMGVLAEVLDLAIARMTVSQVLDLAGREPVRRRFRFADDDLARLEQWVRESYVRWGFDAEHRQAFQLGSIAANTWRSGLDRVLLGVAMAEDGQRLFEGTLPLDDVESGDIELAGRFAEFVQRLRDAVDVLAGERTVDVWAKALADTADSLTVSSRRDAWQRAELTSLLEKLVDEATTAGEVSPVTLGSDDVRSLLAERLKGRATRANFCTGYLTVCTLVPMRSIPHKVVCLLGLDDGSFPRHIERDGDDITALDPRVGDRDARSEDRQLLLDAVLAAREHLVITYSGHDERSNQPRPPAVPVGELLDVIDHTVRTAAGDRSRQAVVVEHPLQPFDARNYEPGRLVPGGPWSFDRLHLDGARAVFAQDRHLSPFLAHPLAFDEHTVDVDVLDRFVRDPVKLFLRQRLGIALWDRTSDYEDAIPIDPNALAKWEIAERILRARLDGASWDECTRAEVARGGLPPAAMADPVLGDMEQDIEALVGASDELSDLPPASVDVHVDLPGLPSLVGTVSGVRGDVIPMVTYRRMQPALRLSAWVRLLALTATYPDRPFEARTIARTPNKSSRRVAVATVGPLDLDPDLRQQVATEHLRTLVDLFRRGMCEPLPLYCKTSAAYAADRAQGRDPDEAALAAKKEWESRPDWDYENRAKEHLFVFGEELPFPDMVRRSGTPGAGEGSLLDPPEPHRFGLYARVLWDAPLEHERLKLQ